jgi:putative phage-type endonuclease
MARILDLEQAGPAWHRWRSQGIGGSDACVILEDVRWTTPEELVEIKLGRRVVEENDRMRRGKALEPEARRLYQDLYGIRVRPVCVVHDDYEWLRASLDGLSLDGTVVLEVKCPSAHAHAKALKGQYPSYYRGQLQHQLLVTGAQELHYFSYRPEPDLAPRDRAARVVVHPDPKLQRRLFEREKRFWENLRRG